MACRHLCFEASTVQVVEKTFELLGRRVIVYARVNRKIDRCTQNYSVGDLPISEKSK